MKRSKPYLSKIREKHPTIEHDAIAYASGSKKTFNKDYTGYMGSVETIDTAIRTIANIISLCDMNLVKVDTKGVKTTANIKNIDLEFPNETDSSVDFLRKLAVNVFSQGAGLIVTEENTRGKLGKMQNFYSLDIARVEAISDGKSLISEFKYTAEDGTEIPYDASKCIYINDSIDPSNLLYSLSRLKALNDVILMQAGLVVQTKELLAGGAKSASIISSDAPISDKNMKVIKTEFDSFMSSATSSSMFMNTPLNVTKIGNTMSGSEMLNLLQELNSMMLKAYAIPPVLLGADNKSANLNTSITYGIRVFFSMQIKPVLKNIEKQFTRFLKEQMLLKNIKMEFSYNDLDILKLAEEEQSAMVLSQLKAGLISLNEARILLEWLPVDSEAADKVFMPQYLLGSSIISYDSFNEDLARSLDQQNAGTTEESLPAGNSGGKDNTNVITDSRGGEQDA